MKNPIQTTSAQNEPPRLDKSSYRSSSSITTLAPIAPAAHSSPRTNKFI